MHNDISKGGKESNSLKLLSQFFFLVLNKHILLKNNVTNPRIATIRRVLFNHHSGHMVEFVEIFSLKKMTF